MALILTFATFAGGLTALEADARLARWRATHAFAADGPEDDEPAESRYAIVVRANGEPLADDETMVGALKVAAGPLRFDIALYDECRIRSPRGDSFEPGDRMADASTITVFVDPLADELMVESGEFLEPTEVTECDEFFDDAHLVEIDAMKDVLRVDPVWVLKPVVVPADCRAG